MSDQKERSAFIGEYGPAHWLALKEEVLDLKAQDLEQILPLIQERAKNSKEELEILDVASGEGQFTMQLYEASKSTRIIALDNYLKYMKTSQRRYKDISQIPCQGNLYDLPFGNGTFDIVATRSTLDIMDGPRMFKEMVRVLKPGGWIYVSLVYDSTYKFAPGSDPELERQVQRAYDKYAIDWGVSYGIKAANGSRGGRFLPLYAWDNGLSIIKLVAADWFLYPNPEFTPKEKAVLFLQLEMIYQACKRVQEPEYAIETSKLDEWYQRIQNDIARNRTTYTSHQFSLLAEKPTK